MNRRAFIQSSGAGLVGLSLIEGYSALTERFNFAVTSHESVIGLDRPLRLVAAGDFHFDPLYEEDYLKSVVATMSSLKADFICFTGDFVSHKTDRMNDLAGILSGATSRYGSYAVIGNHDVISGTIPIIAALEKHGIRVLANESVPIPNLEKWYLSGINSVIGFPDLGFFSRAPKQSNHILLAHEPDPFADLDEPSLRLQISGHTHGGQVRLPAYGPLILPTDGKLFDQGFFGTATRGIYVNRGIGTVPPHVRFNCAPEITCIDLV